jgi:hypothetical protein
MVVVQQLVQAAEFLAFSGKNFGAKKLKKTLGVSPARLGWDPNLLDGGWACTSHPGVLGSIPKREEPGNTGRHPVLKYRVPHGSHQFKALRQHYARERFEEQRQRPSSANDAFDPNLWATFVSTTLVPALPTQVQPRRMIGW